MERYEAMRKLENKLETLQYDRALLLEQLGEAVKQHYQTLGEAPLSPKILYMQDELVRTRARLAHVTRMIELAKQGEK